MIWLVLNIAATILTVYFAIRVFGAEWRTAERLYLSALLLSWAPFRVTLRVGQISLMITALLLGALLARQSKRHVLSGFLLGLSLCKFTMTLPFLLYFVWKRDWRIVCTTVVTVAALTEVYSLRLGISTITVLKDYVSVIKTQAAAVSGVTGTTDIKLLLLGMTGGNASLTLVLTIALCVAALVAMAVVFKRTPQSENVHFAVLHSGRATIQSTTRCCAFCLLRS